jgi:hypothetical protein
MCVGEGSVYDTILAKYLLNESTLECYTLLIKELVVGVEALK